MQKEIAATKTPSGRVKRTPVGKRNVLTMREQDKDPGYQYRFVNDTGDRVQTFLDAGYEPVTDVQVGDKRVGTAAAEGTVTQVSVGQGTKAVLMRIKKDWYEEDQAAKQAAVADVETQAKQKALLDGNYGDLSIGSTQK